MRVEIPGPRGDGTIAAALFDFDETIIDLEAQHEAATAALCREMDAAFDELPRTLLVSGRRLIDEVRDIRAHFGWNLSAQELLARRQRHFITICRDARLTPMPGVREVVEALRQRGVPLAITSSAEREAIELVLERLALRDAFPLVVDGSQVRKGKPDPECFLLTAALLGVEPQGCVVFEDSELGVAAAKRAGMFCIAARNPKASFRQDLSAADVIVDSLLSLVH